ncbi:MAG: tetratricopeptide repeat protein, partial [Chthonomonadaceae bacterium]|nr:tetratricopeptide repeat protein [Chthonomonadaceae bacterium]
MRQRPSDGPLLALLGARLAESGQYPEAANALTYAISAGEKGTFVYLTWAASMAAMGDRPKAQAALMLAVRDRPGDVELRKALARLQELTADATPQQVAQTICPHGTGKLASIYARGSFLNGLVEWLGRQNPEQSGYVTRQRWVQAEPNNAQAQRLWSEALTFNRRYADAVAAAQRAQELAPNSPAAHLALANALYAGGAVSRAGLEYIAALKIRPDWLPALRGLGQVALDKKLLLIATDVFERAVKQAPDDPDLWIGLGRAHYNQRINLARALEAFQTAERLAPERTDYFADYSTTLRANFKHAEAEALLRRRLASVPKDAQCLFLLGLALTDFNPTPERLQEAEKVFRASLELNPDQAATAAQLGRLMLDQGKVEEAIRLLERAIRMDRYNA